jgi:hypothetical protein
MEIFTMNLIKSLTILRTGFCGRLRLYFACLGALLLTFSGRADEAMKPGTLAYYLATNLAARADGRIAGYADEQEVSRPNSAGLGRLTNAVWSQTFWLHGVKGLSATPIGFTNLAGGQGLPTMVSPRHYLCATHMHPEGYLIAFLDTNNVIHWRRTLQRVDMGNDISVGILNADLPPSVGFLPVLPENFTNYLPATSSNFVQGIGMNQDFCLFGQPMTFLKTGFVHWDSAKTAPLGLTKNWNVTLRAGDSSNPDMLLISNQLVLVSHNFFVTGGPNYAGQITNINRFMHLLSKKYHVRKDYKLTEFSLTNWPEIH